MSIQDYTSRKNHPAIFFALDKLIESGDIPEFVKEASAPDADELSRLHDRAFADRENRLYPIHTKSATALSVMDFLGNDIADPKAEKILKRACEDHALEDFFDRVDGIFSEVYSCKSASSESADTVKYAFVIEDEAGAVGWYPIHNEFQLEKSINSFLDDRERIPADIAVGICREFVKAASEFGVLVPDYVAEIGEERLMDLNNVNFQVIARKARLDDAEGAELYDGILKLASAGEDTTELTEMLWELDKEYFPDLGNDPVLEDASVVFNTGATVKSADAEAAKYVYLQEEDLMLPVEAVIRTNTDLVSAVFTPQTSEKVNEIIKVASEDAFTATALLNGLPTEVRKGFVALVLQSNG
jgi:hypothetical protein